jgi:hypothetical protein
MTSDPERVRRLLSRAGVDAPVTAGGGTLATEPLLVFSGRWRSRLDVFDGHGRPIGSAERARTRYKDVGHRCRYELRDSEPMAELRDTTKPRLGRRDYTFSILAANGAEIATARRQSRTSFVFERAGQPMATLRQHSRVARLRGRRAGGPDSPTGGLHGALDRLTGRTFVIADASNEEIARIAYLRSSYMAQGVGYVVEVGNVRDPLRTVALVSCLVVDDRIIDLAQSGAGV